MNTIFDPSFTREPLVIGFPSAVAVTVPSPSLRNVTVYSMTVTASNSTVMLVSMVRNGMLSPANDGSSEVIVLTLYPELGMAETVMCDLLGTSLPDVISLSSALMMTFPCSGLLKFTLYVAVVSASKCTSTL